MASKVKKVSVSRSVARTLVIGIPVLIVLTVWGALGGLAVADIIVLTLIWAALASSWNLIGGFAGQISLGHAAFFGLGAYASTILYVDYGVSPWIGLVVAMLVGAVLSWLVGLPTFRFRGPYFALATLAVTLIAFNWAMWARGITKGQVGVPIPWNPGLGSMQFEERWHYIILTGVFLLLATAVAAGMKSSRLGYSLQALGDDEEAARALGVNASGSKLTAAVFSGAIAGGAGVMYSQYILYISPESVLSLNVSIEALAIAVVGGAGTVLGPILGAAVLIPISHLVLENFGGGIPGLHIMVYGAILVVIVLLSPRGIMGIIETLLGRFKGKQGSSQEGGKHHE